MDLPTVRANREASGEKFEKVATHDIMGGGQGASTETISRARI
jgi:hypothetical protein